MEWLLPQGTCVTLGYFYHSAHYTSALFLVVISYNRYRLVNGVSIRKKTEVKLRRRLVW